MLSRQIRPISSKMLNMKIRLADNLRGTVRLPGDKSISHRSAMIASIANGVSQIENFSTGQDCASTIRCMQQLGVHIELNGTSVIVYGVGKSGLQQPNGPLDCGNSGTTMRLLAGIMAGQSFNSVMTGDESLQLRPMSRVIDPLTKMGAAIESQAGKAPLVIKGKSPLDAIRYETRVTSAQVKSCVILAGLHADGETIFEEKILTRDHTERMLRWFGVHVDSNTEDDCRTQIKVRGDAVLIGRDIDVPGDISSAAFCIAAAACLNGSQIEIQNVGINPTRADIIDVMRRFGADIELVNIRNEQFEPSADMIIRGHAALTRKTDSNVICGRDIAGVIDEIPILAIFGTQVSGGIEIRDAAELRVKESDRIASVVENLKRMGAAVTEFDDGFKVEQSQLKGAVIDSFGDHRIAMAFAVAGLFATGETEIIGAECADISFPGFFELLASVVR